ncbi:RNA methyltransferase [Ignicoccus islandicus DSM 13165]|uniref:RNA methyltransferase n=1 Tax=Ignicoccus islandicus DSM 13165 TaxID=940295 RepID=A0A0U2VBL7_9CREN|nr:RsmD family RNA methyltransferase [Ignicoccus islandicus]ALU11490.1 RNA methyltransferase [Ignicoccus islandicus DSM 13165]
METLYFLISGYHRSIPVEEVIALHEAEGCPFQLLSVHNGLVLGRGDPKCSMRLTYRSAYVKEIGTVGYVSDGVSTTVLKELDCGKLKVHVVGGSEVPEVRLEGKGTCRAIATEDFIVIGKELSKRAHGKSEKGPFFSPGSMDPILARAMVNLSRLKKGGTFLDPFCGTGVFVMEASKVAKLGLCFDLDPAMCYGGRINLKWAGALSDNALTDSFSLPIKSNSVDAIATDPPYGRSVVSLAHDPIELFASFLGEAERVLKPGSYVTFAMSSKVRVMDAIGTTNLKLMKCHVQRVHRSLARLICTLRKA